MCTGVEIAMLASAAVGTVGTIYSGMQQAAAADDQAQIAENNAAYEADAAKQQAEKIRRMAKASEAKECRLAASGEVGRTPLAIQKDIIQKWKRMPCACPRLAGAEVGGDQADMLRPLKRCHVWLCRSVLATGANACGSWKEFNRKLERTDMRIYR